ncbi:NTP transferase domain-containing protein [Portibacter marinus]|uniref:NTP transferase domain-containing protein n=1 Tax=Portibacter marinus TaxID=2898660 RepID=UPI001F23C864|nr:NTP transferase domain-containing protein [Portibacter marinus]
MTLQNKKDAHQKHANLAKPKLGFFAKNEWAIMGAPCGEIRKLVENLSSLTTENILYIDESHDHEEQASHLAIATKKGDAQEFSHSISWNKYQNALAANDYDIVLINGNHFKANKQIVILDDRKKESLSRKLDRLTDVRAFLYTSEVKTPYDFLIDGVMEEDIPLISISDIETIWRLIRAEVSIPSLKALVLAGGKSTRMGEDKAEIEYHGRGQARHMYEMLEGLGLETHLSCRNDQAKKFPDLRVILDKVNGLGPFGAIVSAFMRDPNAAWLVVPCDLPLLEEKHLENLISCRNPFKQATTFLNAETQFPEPLISIWEPKMYLRMLQFLSLGYSCPRKILINSDVELIKVENQQFMMNVNTPDEQQKAHVILEEK